MSKVQQFLVQVAGEWLFGKGKYGGMPLETVAKTDPGYVGWVLKDASDRLPDDAFYALQDAAKDLKR